MCNPDRPNFPSHGSGTFPVRGLVDGYPTNVAVVGWGDVCVGKGGVDGPNYHPPVHTAVDRPLGCTSGDVSWRRSLSRRLLEPSHHIEF